MSVERVIVHMGSDKAGSTAIQESLYANHGWYAEQGIHIPLVGLTPKAGHPQTLGEPRRTDLQRELAAESPECPTVLMSFEGVHFFDELRRNLLDGMLQSVYPDAAVTFVYYVRNQIDLIQTGVLQQIKQLTVPPKTIAELNLPYDEIGLSARRFLSPPTRFFMQRLDEWRGTFRDADFVVRLFARDHLVRGDVVDDFHDAIGLGDRTGFNRAKVSANPSLTAEAALVLHRYFGLAHDDEDRRRAVDVLLGFEGGSGAYLHDDTRRAIAETYAADNRKLVAEFPACDGIDEARSKPRPVIDPAAVEACERYLFDQGEYPTLMKRRLRDRDVGLLNLAEGWRPVGPKGAWAVGPRSVIRFRPRSQHFSGFGESVDITIKGRYADRRGVTDEVVVNGRSLGRVDLEKEPITIRTDDLDHTGNVEIELHHRRRLRALSPTAQTLFLRSFGYTVRWAEPASTETAEPEVVEAPPEPADDELVERERPGEERRELIFHVGIDKTGTTSVQNALLVNSALLAREGYRVLESNRVGVGLAKHRLNWREFDDVSWDLLKQEAAVLSESPSSVIISNELLWLEPPEVYQRIAALFPEHEPLVVMYVRDQAEYLQSLSFQRQKKPERAFDLVEDDGFETLFARRREALQFDQTCEALEAVFGTGSVIARSFDRSTLVRNDVSYDFFDTIGLGDHLDAVELRDERNASLSLETSQALLELRSDPPPGVSLAELRDIALRMSANGVGNRYFLEQDRVEEIREMYRESNERFVERFLANASEIRQRDAWVGLEAPSVPEVKQQILDVAERWPLIAGLRRSGKEAARRPFVEGWNLDELPGGALAEFAAPTGVIRFRMRFASRHQLTGVFPLRVLTVGDAPLVADVVANGRDLGRVELPREPINIPTDDCEPWDQIELRLTPVAAKPPAIKRLRDRTR